MNKDEVIEKFLVREELKIASFTKRLLAFIVDEFIISIIIIIFIYKSIEPYSDNPGMMMIAIQRYFLLVFIISTLYDTILIHKFGFTPGKLLFKIYVVDYQSGNYPSLLNSLIRAIVKRIGKLMFYFGLILALFTKFNQSLEDFSVGTIVVEI